jgi:hypothetical protein
MAGVAAIRQREATTSCVRRVAGLGTRAGSRDQDVDRGRGERGMPGEQPLAGGSALECERRGGVLDHLEQLGRIVIGGHEGRSVKLAQPG